MRTAIASIVMIVFTAAAQATVVIPADLGELARDARAIVRGRVSTVATRWTEDRRGVETIVTLEVESALKGTAGSLVQFRVPGGDLGRYRSVTVGAPTFSVDEHVVVFLGATGPMVPYILGLNQGVFRVVRAADARDFVVTPPPLLPSTSGSMRIVRGDPSRQPAPLAEFEQRVRALAGGAK